MGISDDAGAFEVKDLIVEADSLLANLGHHERTEKSKVLLNVVEKYIKAIQLSTDPDVKKGLRSKATELMNKAESLKSGGLKTKASDSKRPVSSTESKLEPESTRKPSNAEKRLILLASRSNGMKFPPWTRTPNASDFALHSKSLRIGSSNDGLFIDPTDFSLCPVQKDNFQGWLRSTSAIPPPSWFGGKGLSPTMKADLPTDLVQDAVPDCSVVASICVEQSRVQRGFPTLLSKIMFPYDEHSGSPRLSPSGRYIFKFNFNGCSRMVDIDDRLPVSKSRRVLHIADRNNPNLIWPALLEKAYLKLRGGYDFRGSNSSTDIWIMYGWIPEQIYLHHAYDLAVWERIAKGFVSGNVLITMGTGAMSPLEEKEYGLASRHDYAVVDISEEGQPKRLLLKNPWCEETLWQELSVTKSSATDNGKVEQPRGSFWIAFEEVFQHFVSMYLNWNPAKFTHREDIHFPWTVPGQTNGSATYIDNPQISLKSCEPGEVWILLSHHFCEGCSHELQESEPRPSEQTMESSTVPHDRFSNGSMGSIALSVFHNHGKLVYRRGGAIKDGSFAKSFHTILTINALAAETYTVVVAEEGLSARDHTFTLTAFSNGPIELSPATREYLYSSSIDSGWSSEAEGLLHPINDTSGTQLKMSISTPTKFSMLLRSEATNDKINLKICHGGKRIHSLRRQDIILDSGELHNGADFCESGPELFQPGNYTVIASVFGKPGGKTFTLRTDSSAPLQISVLPSEDAGKFILTLPDAVFNPSVKKVALSLDPLRYITITVIGKYTKRLLPSAVETPKPASGSPVRLSLEIGQGPMKHIAAMSNSGEYSDSVGSAARLADVNLNPDMNSLGSLWLVVERLSTGMGDMPEHYKMDVLIAGGVGEHLKISSWQDRDED